MDIPEHDTTKRWEGGAKILDDGSDGRSRNIRSTAGSASGRGHTEVNFDVLVGGDSICPVIPGLQYKDPVNNKNSCQRSSDTYAEVPGASSVMGYTTGVIIELDIDSVKGSSVQRRP